MFFKKKSEPVEKVNAYDAMYKEKWKKVQNIDLRQSVIRTLRAEQALSIYVEGPEKEEAMSRLERAKKSLIQNHKLYTELRNDAINFFKEYQYDMDKWCDLKPTSIPTAHYLVELECQRYYQK